MKAITDVELQAHLSRDLRIASRGGRIIVKDRDDPIAQLGPPPPATLLWHERLAQVGRLRVGTQNCSPLKVSAVDGSVDIQTSLRGGYGLLVSLGDFTPQSSAFARGKSNLRLIGGADLVDLVFQYYEQFDLRYKSILPLKRVYIPEAFEEA